MKPINPKDNQAKTSSPKSTGTAASLGGKSSAGIGGTQGGSVRGGSKPTTGKSTGPSGSYSQTGTGTTGSSTSKGNISFGAVDFDSQKNLLKVRTTQGSNQILCCITGDALRECFHAGTSAQELEKTFHQHEREIQYCAQQKIQNKQWKVPNQEILLNTQDLREFTK